MLENRHLRYFIEVAKSLHVRRAAERLHLAQPALTQNIPQLERELGVELFHRESRHLRLGRSAVRFRSKRSAGRLPARASGSLLWGHMHLRLLVPVSLQRSLLKVSWIAPNSCQSHRADSGPSIEFTHIPPLDQRRRLLSVRTAGRGGCSPGRLTNPNGDR